MKTFRALRTLLCILLLSTSCCHMQRTAPPTEGYFGLIHKGKPVYCIVDNDMRPAQCEVVKAQVRVINGAVSTELLHYAGIRHINSMADIPPKEQDSIIVGMDNLAPGILGQTGPRAATTDGYILQTIVIISHLAFQPPYTPGDIILHELLHACGLAHAEEDGLFASTMRPHAQPNLHGLTPGDIAALRAGYAN